MLSSIIKYFFILMSAQKPDQGYERFILSRKGAKIAMFVVYYSPCLVQ